jgi:hypothetical protein
MSGLREAISGDSLDEFLEAFYGKQGLPVPSLDEG